MLNLAGLSARMSYIVIALHKKGYQLSGYDDEIFKPSKGRLDSYGSLPKIISSLKL